VDLALCDRTVLLGVGTGRLCGAISQACLEEGANVAIAASNPSDVEQIRAPLTKRFGLRVRAVADGFVSADVMNLTLAELDRWAPPVTGVVCMWSEAYRQADPRGVGPAAGIAVALRTMSSLRSLLFLYPVPPRHDERQATDSTAIGLLERPISTWSRFAGSERRVNLLCLPGEMSGPQWLHGSRRSQSGSASRQTIDRAFAAWVAFLVSPASSLFSARVLPFEQTGLSL
jgi:hypothetical protein